MINLRHNYFNFKDKVLPCAWLLISPINSTMDANLIGYIDLIHADWNKATAGKHIV